MRRKWRGARQDLLELRRYRRAAALTGAARLDSTTALMTVRNMSIPSSKPGRIYLPGIDAMRGIVVIIGMFFHANVTLFKSGMFFIDVFGVLSGYLITRVLLGEYALTGKIAFKAFYLNRARRLLPALFMLLVAVVLYARAFEPQVLWDLRVQTLASLGYVYNWYAIFAGGDYFASYDVIPIQHLWSLSLEEQFYMIAPIALVGALSIRSRRVNMLKLLPYTLLVGAVASAVAAWAIFHGGDTTGTTDTVRAPMEVFGFEASRLLMAYMSTIARAGGFMVGCALAFWWQPDLSSRPTSKRFDRMLDAAGILAMVSVFLLTNLQWFTDNVHEAVVNGGAVTVWLICAVLIMAFTKTESRWLHFVFTRKPLIRLGVVSYALYLYHWPVMQFIRKYPFKPLPEWALPVLLPVLWAIAELSQKYFERPIRRNGLLNYLRSMGKRTRLLVVGLATVLTLGAVVSLLSAPRENSDLATALEQSAAAGGGLNPGETAKTVAIGDSITQLMYAGYRDIGVVVDAAPARTFGEGVAIAEYLHEAGMVTDSVVMHLGSNEKLTADTLRASLTELTGLRRVVLVTLWREDWSFLETNNDVIRSMADEFENVVVIDWNRVVADNPEFVLRDGIHISKPTGMNAYMTLVSEALKAERSGVITEMPS